MTQEVTLPQEQGEKTCAPPLPGSSWDRAQCPGAGAGAAGGRERRDPITNERGQRPFHARRVES